MTSEKSGKPFSVRKRFHSFRYAFAGLKHAWNNEHNFRIHLLATAIVIAAGIYFHVDKTEWAILAFAIGFVIVTELINTAIELLADVVSPEKNKIIGRAKDISAAAVLISAVTAVITGVLVFYPHIKLLFS
jgi:undecaprenol kinase/diacylglycerol kinase (ATP)